MGLIDRLALGAEVPVFPVVGAGGRHAAEELSHLRGVRVVDHPRAAALLVVVGRLTRALLHPALIVHDQLPGPRTAVWMPVGTEDEQDPEGLLAAFPSMTKLLPGDGSGLRAVFTELISGARPSDPPALPDLEPARWRGVGPYGHGGTGMTGGVPYGRPLPARAPDPDGLELDQLPLQIGPLYPPFPPGLVLHIGLQGDVVRHAVVGANPYCTWPGDPAPGPLDTALFVDALGSPAPVADLELARARHHLGWTAGFLRLHGLGARGQRVSAIARSLSLADRDTVDALARRLTRSRSLAWATDGVGVADGALLDRLEIELPPGPVRRSTEDPHDARSADPAYEGLGFEPVVPSGGDAWARLRQRLAEASQALVLAERAGARVRQPGPPLEGPRGTLRPEAAMPSAALLALLPELLAGSEWGDAVTTVASLDLDVEEAAVHSLTPASGSRTVGMPADSDYQNSGGPGQGATR